MDPVRYISGLLLVAALLAAGFWLLRRHGPGLGRASHGLRITAVLPLGAREKLVVVQYHSRELLLGVSAQGIRRLASAAPASAKQQDQPSP